MFHWRCGAQHSHLVATRTTLFSQLFSNSRLFKRLLKQFDPLQPKTKTLVSQYRIWSVIRQQRGEICHISAPPSLKFIKPVICLVWERQEQEQEHHNPANQNRRLTTGAAPFCRWETRRTHQARAQRGLLARGALGFLLTQRESGGRQQGGGGASPQGGGELRLEVGDALVLLLQAHLPQLGLQEPVLLLLLQPGDLLLALLHLPRADGWGRVGRDRGAESVEQPVGGGLSDGSEGWSRRAASFRGTQGGGSWEFEITQCSLVAVKEKGRRRNFKYDGTQAASCWPGALLYYLLQGRKTNESLWFWSSEVWVYYAVQRAEKGNKWNRLFSRGVF